MSSNLKIPSPWSQLALLTILAGGALIVASLAVLMIPGYHPGQIPTNPAILKEVQVTSSLLLFGAPALLYAQLTFREHPLDGLGLRPATKNSFYWVAIALMACALPLEGWLGMINKNLPLSHWMVHMEQDQDAQIATVLSGKRPIDMVINVVVIAIVPGFVEELCFRGALQRVLIQLFKSPLLGIILTGFWFAFSHLEFERFFPIAFLGMVLGAIYWYTESLWTVILAHALYNGVQVVAAMRYPDMLSEDPSVPFYLAAISLVFVVGLLAYMRKRSTVSYAKVYPAGKSDDFDDFLANR